MNPWKQPFQLRPVDREGFAGRLSPLAHRLMADHGGQIRRVFLPVQRHALQCRGLSDGELFPHQQSAEYRNQDEQDQQADKAQQKLKTLLALQNEPIMITGALISNYLDLYRVLLGRRSRRSLGDVAKDFGYKGNWNYRLNSTEKTALRFKRAQLEACLHILQRLDTDLKSSKLDADLLMQKALCELALAGRA